MAIDALIFPSPKPIEKTPIEKEPLEITNELRMANLRLKVLDITKDWCDINGSNKDANYDLPGLIKEVDSIMSLLRYKPKKGQPLTKRHVRYLQKRIQEKSLKLSGKEIDSIDLMLITEKNPFSEDSNDRDAFANGLKDVIHDVANEINPVKGISELILMKKPYNNPLQTIAEQFPEIKRTIEQQLDSIKKGARFEKEEIQTDELQKKFEYAFMKYFLSAFGKIGQLQQEIKLQDIPKGYSVKWSNFWMDALISNIAQNSIRAFQAKKERGLDNGQEKKFTVSAKIKDGFLEIAFEDNAIGYSMEKDNNGSLYTIDTGYGTDKVTSTGTAMKRHAAILEKYYNGKIIPSNRKNETGDVLGAITTVRIPLVPAA